MDLEQAITAAIEYELRIRDVYRKAADRCGDPRGRRVLDVLADEEQQHLDYLRARLDELARSGRITVEPLSTRFPAVAEIQRGLGSIRERLQDTPSCDESELLAEAIQVETETGEFYRRMASELAAEDRPLFQRFVEIEQGHLAIVQAEYDTLRGLGFWFDLKEFDLEAG
ncbi:MAG: ferritin family protein [Deltaproteobacteria bacterium]|nr:ferritin family protein [Deltaproteobacteria bacterium]